MDTERHHLQENRKPRRLEEEKGYIHFAQSPRDTEKKGLRRGEEAGMVAHRNVPNMAPKFASSIAWGRISGYKGTNASRR